MPLLTPQFDLSQDEKHIILKLRLPYLKVSKAEFSIQKNEVQFFLKPYLLKLCFKEELKEADFPAKSVYDPSNYTLTVNILKQQEGQHFEGLNLISQLMQKKRVKQEQKKVQGKKPLIQVIDSTENEQDEETKECPQLAQIESLMGKHNYGFAERYDSVFNDLDDELYEIAILNPQMTPKSARLELLKQHTMEMFDKEHYLFDFLENEEIDLALEFQYEQVQSEFKYTIDEIKILESLKGQEMIVDNIQTVNLQIVDILFAYLYEQRVMQNDLEPESASTIQKISISISGFVTEDDLKGTLILNFERALCFPLLRSFELCELTLQDLIVTLQSELLVTKYFINLKQLFKKSEPRHLINTLYIDDIIAFIQSGKFQSKQTVEELKKIKIQKQDLQFDLEKIEKAALSEIIAQDG